MIADRLELLRQASEPVSTEFSQLLGPAALRPRGGNPAAEWRLRVKRQAAIHERLMEIGPFAAMSCGSLLILGCNGDVTLNQRTTNWRSTLEASELFECLDQVRQGQLKGLKSENWRRLEQGLQSLGHMIVLSAENMRCQRLISAFSTFKLRCISYAIATDEKLDHVLEYIKWIGKANQAAFLGIKIPDKPGPFSVVEDGIHLPFVGELAFVNDVLIRGRRTTTMSFGHAAVLAQLGNLPRSLPYPSQDQVRDDIKRTLNTVQQRTESAPEALKQYELGLRILKDNIPMPTSMVSHVSLLGSGSVESSRAHGGRAACLVINARTFADKDFKQYLGLVEKYDQFGRVILHKFTVDTALRYSADNNVVVNLGTLMYVPGYEADSVLENYFVKGLKVPRHLADILNLTASMLIRTVGSYEPAEKCINEVMYFETRNTRFKLEKRLLVNADVSIEAGMKSRMTTSAMAAFAHLSQLPANFMRDYLSNDPFHRVGFQESDKLWEVLKTYRKAQDRA